MKFGIIWPLLILGLLYPVWTPISAGVDAIVLIPDGHSVAQIGLDLESAGVVNSAFGFKLIVKLLGADSSLKSGRYRFEGSLPVWRVVARVSAGDFGVKQLKVTIPEGYTNEQIGQLLGKKLDDSKQGYLFPDTYYFDEFASIDEVRDIMLANFVSRVGTTSDDIVIVASILEREVRSKEDMELVAGILYQRLKIGMPLQVDAVPSTYDSRGLPTKPVANPGLQAIRAAENPKKSQYLYYLSGKDGTTHYARNFDEHKVNKSLYLR